jgi:hypothetical protein
MQQRASGDNATTVSAKVSQTGLSELAGLPSNLSGFARAIVKLRDTYGPNVILAYHLSVWGTATDIALANPAIATRGSTCTSTATAEHTGGTPTTTAAARGSGVRPYISLSTTCGSIAAARRAGR